METAFITKSDESTPFELADFNRLKEYQSSLMDMLVYNGVEKNKIQAFRMAVMAEIQSVEKYLKGKEDFVNVFTPKYHSEPTEYEYYDKPRKNKLNL